MTCSFLVLSTRNASVCTTCATAHEFPFFSNFFNVGRFWLAQEFVDVTELALSAEARSALEARLAEPVAVAVGAAQGGRQLSHQLRKRIPPPEEIEGRKRNRADIRVKAALQELPAQ
jgi:hypothetical protein